MSYKLEVNKQQLLIMSKALELYSRLGSGQFECLLEHAAIDKYLNKKCLLEDIKADTDIDWAKRGLLSSIAREHIDFLKKVLMDCHPSGSHGIYNKDIDNSCRTAWDMQQVIRHQLWSERSDRLESSVASYIGQSDNDNDLIIIKND